MKRSVWGIRNRSLDRRLPHSGRRRCVCHENHLVRIAQEESRHPGFSQSSIPSGCLNGWGSRRPSDPAVIWCRREIYHRVFLTVSGELSYFRGFALLRQDPASESDSPVSRDFPPNHILLCVYRFIRPPRDSPCRQLHRANETDRRTEKDFPKEL
jgi:hypothetical protein